MPYLYPPAHIAGYPRHALTERSAGPLRARSPSAVRSGQVRGRSRLRAVQSGQLLSLHVASIICLLLSQGLQTVYDGGTNFPINPYSLYLPRPILTRSLLAKALAGFGHAPPEREARRVGFGLDARVCGPNLPTREPRESGDLPALAVLGTPPGSHARGHGAYHEGA